MTHETPCSGRCTLHRKRDVHLPCRACEARHPASRSAESRLGPRSRRSEGPDGMESGPSCLSGARALPSVPDTDTTTTAEPPFGIVPADDQDRYMRTSIHPSIHVLAVRPAITFDSNTYPSFTIAAHSDAGRALMTLSLTGGPTSRAAFVANLRSIADQIEGWSR